MVGTNRRGGEKEHQLKRVFFHWKAGTSRGTPRRVVEGSGRETATEEGKKRLRGRRACSMTKLGLETEGKDANN